MDETLLTWNLPNWITVVLMAALGYIVLAAISQFVIKGSTGALGFFSSSQPGAAS